MEMDMEKYERLMNMKKPSFEEFQAEKQKEREEWCKKLQPVREHMKRIASMSEEELRELDKKWERKKPIEQEKARQDAKRWLEAAKRGEDIQHIGLTREEFIKLLEAEINE